MTAYSLLPHYVIYTTFEGGRGPRKGVCVARLTKGTDQYTHCFLLEVQDSGDGHENRTRTYTLNMNCYLTIIKFVCEIGSRFWSFIGSKDHVTACLR